MTYSLLSQSMGHEIMAADPILPLMKNSPEMQSSSRNGLHGAMRTTLDRLGMGVEGRVIAVEGSDAVARRLMEMGVVPGALVCVVKAAPLGDPLEVRVRNYHLALRRNEAQTIRVVTSDE